MSKPRSTTVRVTDKSPHNNGSQTLRVSLVDPAGILPYKQMHCLNMSNGAQWMAAATRENRVCGKEFN